MDFSNAFGSGGIGDSLASAGGSFLNSITGTLGKALGDKLNDRLGLGAPRPNAPPTPSPVPAAAAPQAAIMPATAAGAIPWGMIGAAVGITAAIGLAVFAVVKLAK